jgi:O-antigen ligase
VVPSEPVPIEAQLESTTAARARQLRRVEVTPALLLFVAALPVLFLHAAFQPTIAATVGSTHIDLRLSDLAVLAIVGSAVIAARREGTATLRHGVLIWTTAAVFLLWVLAATFYPLASSASYPWRTHLVTAVKYAEYAVIALAVPLVLRTRRDLRAFGWTLAAVSALATLVALLQFFGAGIFRAWPSGGRQPSFVGVDDLGMLSAAAYAISLALVTVGTRGRGARVLAWTAGVAGGLGMVLSGALASVLGALLASVVALVVARRFAGVDVRRAVVVCAMALAVLAGSVFMRSAALGDFARFAGLGQSDNGARVESYSHRWVLDYIGLKMFLRQPVLGAGWQAGYDEEAYGPVLADAHRRFPSQPALAFPSPAHPWGIQSAYVEVLAELGIVGGVLFVAWIAAGLWTALRSLRAARSLAWHPFLGVLWLCVVLGVWNGLWFIGGIPFDALIWLAFGFAATPPLVLAEAGR